MAPAAPRLGGPKAPDILLDRLRPANDVLGRHVERKLARIAEAEAIGEHHSATEQSHEGGARIIGGPHELRELPGISEERAENSVNCQRAVGSDRHQGSVGKLPVSRVGDNAKNCKGQPKSGSDPGGNMRFRICGERTRLAMEVAPFRNP